MRSFLAAALALALASLVAANPNPEPNNIPIGCGALDGKLSGPCNPGYSCLKGSNNKYSCVKPPPPVCSAYVLGTCPTGQDCTKGSDGKYSCKTPMCGGIKMGTCPKGQSCQAGPRPGQYHCVTPGYVYHNLFYSRSDRGTDQFFRFFSLSFPFFSPVPSGKIKTKRAAFCAEGSVACPVRGSLHGFECINIKVSTISSLSRVRVVKARNEDSFCFRNFADFLLFLLSLSTEQH